MNIVDMIYIAIDIIKTEDGVSEQDAVNKVSAIYEYLKDLDYSEENIEKYLDISRFEDQYGEFAFSYSRDDIIDFHEEFSDFFEKPENDLTSEEQKQLVLKINDITFLSNTNLIYLEINSKKDSYLYKLAKNKHSKCYGIELEPKKSEMEL